MSHVRGEQPVALQAESEEFGSVFALDVSTVFVTSLLPFSFVGS